MTTPEIDIPEEILDKLQSFHDALKNVDEVLRPLTTVNINSSDVQISPLDKAKLHLSCGYALNSLFWMYLTTRGIDPKEHSIKTELERYKSFMLRLKEINDKDKAPVLDKAAAGRFVRNALWEPKQKEAEETDDSSSSDSDEPAPVKEEKRPQSSYGNVNNKRRRH